MDNSLYLDLYMFLSSVYGGLIAGFIYDLSRTFRFFSRGKRLITYIQDLVFWGIITLLFFYLLIKINWGEIRGFIVLGFILGIIVYIKTFSRFVFPILVKTSKFIFEIFKSIFGCIIFPFKYIKQKITKPFNKIRKIPKEIIKDAKKYKKIISSKK